MTMPIPRWKKTKAVLDIEEARRRFDEIRRQNEKTKRSLARGDRKSNAVQKNLAELSELFKYLKLTPKQSTS